MEDRKKIHKTENHIREIQSPINIMKFAILVIIMDTAQNLDSRNNIFLELMYMSRNALFAGKNVCMPHPPSVGAGIPWVEHPISNCDTCTLFKVHTSGIYNKSTCHNITTPPASPRCIPGLPSCNLSYSHHDRSTLANYFSLVPGKLCSSLNSIE